MKPRAWMCAASLAVALPSARADAQSVRVSGSSSMQFIQLRPFTRDSVLATETTGTELLRQLPDGSVVRCIPGEEFCSQVHAGSVISTIPMIHDLDVSVWGFGRGLRVFSQLRGRTTLGPNNDLWPREDRPLDVLSLYGEMERGAFRVRAGRQWRVSGLGFYNFDGLAMTYHPTPTAWLEVYGGHSLSRGLNEGRTGGALETVETLSTPNSGILFGMQGRYRPSPRLTVGAMYQIDLRGDRAGAYSELATADGALRVGKGSLESSVEVDLAGRALNHARLTARSAPIGNATFFAEARRYRPYFELWTIWGAFSPVGFDEGSAGMTWAARDGRLIARGQASYRTYGDPETETIDAYRTRGWGLESALNWSPVRTWHFDGSARLQSGFGASRWDSQAGARRDIGARGNVGAQIVAFQQLFEFRTGAGTVFGLGGDGTYSLNDRVRVFASAFAYRQHGGAPADINWNQVRATLRLEWVVGSEPGALTSAGAPP
jgi:hypothetical protein